MKYKIDIDNLKNIGIYNWREDKELVLQCNGFANFEFGGKECISNYTNIEELTPTPTGVVEFEDYDEIITPILKNDFFFKAENFSLRPGNKNHRPKDCIIHINRKLLIPIEE